MPKIIFITADNQEYPVDAAAGQTAMDAALDNMVPGIDGDCGGLAACGTCHVHADDQWLERIGAAQPGVEQDMLLLTDNATSNSRLACQIVLEDEHDGLILHMPAAQH